MSFETAKVLLTSTVLVATCLCIGSAQAVNSGGTTAFSEETIHAVSIQTARLEPRTVTTPPTATHTAAAEPARAPHEGMVTDLFAGHSWYTAPPAPAPRERIEPVVSEPTAPPLPYSYMGTLAQDGADTLYFLVKGDRVYDVKVGDVLDGTYRIDSVSNGQLIFTYLPLNTSQGLRLGESK